MRCVCVRQPEGSYDTYDAELDVDELIDFATDSERVSYIKVQHNAHDNINVNPCT